MRRQRKRLEMIEVPDQGHARILEPDIVGRIAVFVALYELNVLAPH